MRAARAPKGENTEKNEDTRTKLFQRVAQSFRARVGWEEGHK